MILNNLLKSLVLLAVSLSAVASDDDVYTYTLNPGDVLMVSVWNEESLQQEVMVLPDGTISFPLVGILSVADKTPAVVQELIKTKLSRVIPDPEINITVRSVTGNNIFIIGKVSRPGRIALIRPTDVMQALSLAGGLTPYAKGGDIKIIRRNADAQQVIKFDYKKLLDGKALESNILLESGDTIIVP